MNPIRIQQNLDNIEIGTCLDTNNDEVAYASFPSETRPEINHSTVMRLKDAEASCTCEGFKYRGHCKHVNSMKILAYQDKISDKQVALTLRLLQSYKVNIDKVPFIVSKNIHKLTKGEASIVIDALLKHLNPVQKEEVLLRVEKDIDDNDWEQYCDCGAELLTETEQRECICRGCR